MEESDEGGGGGGGGSVYQDSGEEEASPAGVSARVSGMAEGVYRELERLMGEHGEAVLRDLVPLVVGVLEALDAAAAQGHERQVELELLREDNEQLLTQYERERTLRRQAEEKYIEYEDALEQDRNALLGKVETLELQLKQMEIRSKFYSDQISRLEDRETELKKEYSALRHRYTEVIQAYMEHVERNKMLQSSGQVEGGSVRMRPRRNPHRVEQVKVEVTAAVESITEETLTAVTEKFRRRLQMVIGCIESRSAEYLGIFKSCLKTHLFRKAFESSGYDY